LTKALPSLENGNVTLRDCKRNEVDRFIEQAQANTFQPTIKFTAEISENEITFLENKREINRKIHLRHQNLLEADGNLLIYPF